MNLARTLIRGSLLASTLLTACASGSSAKGTTGAAHPLARKVAPDVALKLSGGGEFHPKDALGKVLVLDFWATWCQPCKASFPKVDAVYKKLAAKGLEVVAVNEDEDPKGVDAFVKETAVTFKIAFDDKQLAAEAFGVETMPSSFVLDRKGVIRYVHAGYHPDDSATIEAEITELLAEAP